MCQRRSGDAVSEVVGPGFGVVHPSCVVNVPSDPRGVTGMLAAGLPGVASGLPGVGAGAVPGVAPGAWANTCAGASATATVRAIARRAIARILAHLVRLRVSVRAAMHPDHMSLLTVGLLLARGDLPPARARPPRSPAMNQAPGCCTGDASGAGGTRSTGTPVSAATSRPTATRHRAERVLRAGRPTDEVEGCPISAEGSTGVYGESRGRATGSWDRRRHAGVNHFSYHEPTRRGPYSSRDDAASRKMYMKNILTASILTLIVLAGCEAPVEQQSPGELEREYADEPLGKLQGEVTNPDDGQIPALEVVLLWRAGEEAKSGSIIGATAPLTGDSSMNFELPVFTPPPEAALQHDAESGVDFTIAWIVAMPKGATSGQEFGVESVSQIQGAAPEHIVLYTSAPVAADTHFAALHGGGPISAGYHLRRVDNPTKEEMEAFWACREVVDAKCPFDQPLDAECGKALNACGHPQGRVLPTSQDESISLILGSLGELELPDFF
jgi:hypothetical protein